MKYIKCILLYSKEPIYINIDKIEAIIKNSQDETFIKMTGTNNSYYTVLESVDAVLNMINDISN